MNLIHRTEYSSKWQATLLETNGGKITYASFKSWKNEMVIMPHAKKEHETLY